MVIFVVIPKSSIANPAVTIVTALWIVNIVIRDKNRYINKTYLPNLGFMRTTEIMNRTIASTLGKHALDIHTANLAGIKVPSTRGLSKTDSRRIMLDVFEFTPDQVSDMIYRRRNTGKNGQMQPKPLCQ